METMDEFDTFGTLFTGEALHVEELLDFDLGDLEEAEQASSSSPAIPAFSSALVISNGCGQEDSRITSCCLGQGNDAGLYLPHDALAELDWLSFMQGSYPVKSKAFVPLASINHGKLEEDHCKSSKQSRESRAQISLFAQVVKSARSKRARSGGRVWCLQMQALKRRQTEKWQRWAKGAAKDAGSDYSCPGVDFFGMPKKRSKKAACNRRKDAVPRRCSHCQAHKTPQWRAGPLGPKSLCNACGVRYKSGRLLPEYRPAASPSFRSGVHSNSHGKVLEMRRRKPKEELAVVPLAAP